MRHKETFLYESGKVQLCYNVTHRKLSKCVNAKCACFQHTALHCSSFRELKTKVHPTAKLTQSVDDARQLDGGSFIYQHILAGGYEIGKGVDDMLSTLHRFTIRSSGRIFIVIVRVDIVVIVSIRKS